MKISNVNIAVDRKKCIACGACVDRCIMDNLRLLAAPCRQACPLGINCQGYLRYLAQGDGDKAAEELRKATPFAGILGFVCGEPCKMLCERGNNGEGAVRIRAVKRYLAETYPQIVQANMACAAATGKKVAVLGTGPASMQAAYELLMLGHAVTLHDAAAQAGGALRNSSLPTPVLEAALAQLACLGATFVLGQENSTANLQATFDAVLAEKVNGDVDPVTSQVKGMDKVFVAGDALGASVVHAMASGKQTALCIHRKLMDIFPIALDYDTEAGIVHETPLTDAIRKVLLESAAANSTTDETLNAEQARKEANRCLSCGRAYEANHTCWFCLPCELDCPQQALAVKIPYLVR